MALDLAPALRVLRQEVPGLAGVYLFGSHASGYARADSDVDLAVYAAAPLSLERRLELALRLGSVLSRDVDLVDLRLAPTVLQMQVVTEGRLIDCADAPTIGLFESRIIRDYFDLRIRRAGIDADIAERGRVHA